MLKRKKSAELTALTSTFEEMMTNNHSTLNAKIMQADTALIL
jgi:hypothetical protein